MYFMQKYVKLKTYTNIIYYFYIFKYICFMSMKFPKLKFHGLYCDFTKDIISLCGQFFVPPKSDIYNFFI